MSKPATSADLSEFTAENQKTPTRCPVRRVLGELDPDYATRLQAALDAPTEVIQHAAISRTLAKWGVQLHALAIGRHRKGNCACGR